MLDSMSILHFGINLLADQQKGYNKGLRRKTSKYSTPHVKQSNFNLFLIASVSKILVYLKANLNSSASIIATQVTEVGLGIHLPII